MRERLFPLILIAIPALAQPKMEDSAAAAMQASLAKQRVSIEKQRHSVSTSSFFALPPPDPFEETTGAAALDCDPLTEDQLKPIVEEESKRAGVQIELVRNVIRQESGGRPCAISAKGAEGLMQLMPATSQQFGVKDPFDPRENVQAGAKLLKQLLTRYDGNVAKALAAYNAGPARVDQNGGVPNIPETMQYVNAILSALPH